MVRGQRAASAIHTGRDFDRLINFSDAVVAVAITVLVLAIVDIRPDLTDTSVWSVIGDNGGQIITFFFTFFVVAQMWLAHNRVLNRLRGYDGAIFWLNLTWLAGIAFLPWPSAMFGEGFTASGTEVTSDAQLDGTGLLYWFTLAMISLMGWLIAWHASRYPAMLDPERQPDAPGASSLAQFRGLLFAVLFVGIGIVSTVAPDAAAWMPLLIIPLSVFMRRAQHRATSPAP